MALKALHNPALMVSPVSIGTTEAGMDEPLDQGTNADTTGLWAGAWLGLELTPESREAVMANLKLLKGHAQIVEAALAAEGGE
jgi:Protein of unknown function (DUF4089)